MNPRQLDAWVYILKSLTNAAITFIFNHPPQYPSPGHDSKGADTRPSGCIVIMYKNLPQDKTGSQKPHPQDIKLGNFTNVFINSLTLVAFLSQQMKVFFNEDTDHCNKNYIICWSLDSTYGHAKLYMTYINGS